MKILLVSSYLPYPLHDGGRIRLYNLLKFLKDKHEITLVCEKRDNQTPQDIAEVEKVCHKVITVRRKKQWSAANILKTAFSLDPFLITGHKSSEMKQAIISELDNGDYDLIHVETFYVMQNLPKTTLPIVLVEHNIEYLVYRRYADKANALLKPVLRIDIAKIKRAERNCWKRANALVTVSLSEQERIGPQTLLVPNGVDTKRFSLKKFDKNKKEKTVLFIGDFKWIQNRDSIVYIIKNIWPKISSKYPQARLWVVGKSIPDSIKDLATDKIFFDENATNKTEEIFQAADILLSPIRVGGGTNFKILESMSCGTPVITNKLGNEGLHAKDKSEILICDKPDEFANTTVDLLKDVYLYEKIMRNSRDFVVKNYDWISISLKLDAIYKSFAK